MLAGARALVTAMWRVADAQTVELMDDFYRRLGTGATAIDALHCTARSSP